MDQSFWLDEASQAQMSSMSLSQIWSDRSADFHPPLFYVLAHFWLQLGRSDVWLRLLPISFGVINIYVIYIFANKLLPKKNSGLLASLFLAIAPFHIYYSQEFRSYSLLCLLGTLSMYFLFKKKYLSLAIVNSLLFYSHYSSVFLILTQILLVTKLDYKKYIIHNTLYLILILPWLPQFVSQLGSGVNIDTYLPGWRSVLSTAPLKTLPVTLFKIVAGRISFLSRYLYGLYIVFVLIVTFA
ncbi:MAG: glycosyltransferase family 39 protein [Patescibacteria group bacterium]